MLESSKMVLRRQGVPSERARCRSSRAEPLEKRKGHPAFRLRPRQRRTMLVNRSSPLLQLSVCREFSEPEEKLGFRASISRPDSRASGAGCSRR
jgi:hypothetical protein